MGKVIDRLLAATADIWAGYYDHPFIQGITNGSLSQDQFRFYLLEDYVYLIDYARVFAMGVTKSRDPELMRRFAVEVHLILDGEMNLHRDYMKRLGITTEQADSYKPSLDNLSYTSYMNRVAYDGGPAEILAAILSCSLSYAAIAREILKKNPEADKHPFYGHWVKEYSSPGYCEDADFQAELLEQQAKDYSEEQLAYLTEIFVNCSRYERKFWDMAWNMGC